MSFVIQRQAGRGLALTQLRGDVLRIGRGTNAELRSENPAVALEHSVIQAGPGGYTITDKGSITGTYVNRRPVESAVLAKGDIIEIGDLRIEVQVADAATPLFLRLLTTAGGATAAEEAESAEPVAAAMERGGAVRAKKIDYVRAYKLRRPYITKVSLAAVLLIIGLGVIAEVTKPDRRTAFMPGGVSSAHARARDASGQPIAKNCAACHDAWKGVSDSRCVSCHAKEPHSLLQTVDTPCTECHTEHRAAARLALMGDAKCISCHADLPAHERKPSAARRTASGNLVASILPGNPKAAHVTSFGDQHPELTPLRDPDTLKFNHALHLKAGGIFNGSGRREELQCTQCHKLIETKGKVDPKPIRFEQDCQRCHRLTFDQRFPDLEVPHGGDPGLVYGFVLAAYAGNRDIAGKSPEEVRRILTSRPQGSPDESAVLNAEQVVKAKCTLCHEIRREEGRLAATPPEILGHWMEHAKFTHTQHRDLSCESCHAARRSSLTSDVLMPDRSACVSCHGAQAASKISSNCVTCHEYHEHSKLLLTGSTAGLTRTPSPKAPQSAPIEKPTSGGSGILETILIWTAVLLILVVLVPVGIALYQRVRASEGDGEPKAAARPAAPPKVKIPPLGSQAAAPPPAPAAPPRVAPAPPPPSPAAAEATQMANLKPEAPAAPMATEAIQWNGMIRCTGGALEGQTFIIEENGIYIGRDSTLSNVVVPDDRISKRHVRIVGKNGKVYAIDQNSTNGTFLGKAGGQRITEVQLKRGDVLVLADNAATFVYQI